MKLKLYLPIINSKPIILNIDATSTLKKLKKNYFNQLFKSFLNYSNNVFE